MVGRLASVVLPLRRRVYTAHRTAVRPGPCSVSQPLADGISARRCDATGYVATYPPTFAGLAGSLPVSIAPQPVLVLYSTVNGGATWHPGTPLRVSTGSAITGPMPVLAALNSRTVWVLMHSRLYITSDTGRHWTVVANHPGLGDRPSLQFVTSKVGFALSPGKSFVRVTSDGGSSWHKVFTRTA